MEQLSLCLVHAWRGMSPPPSLHSLLPSRGEGTTHPSSMPDGLQGAHCSAGPLSHRQARLLRSSWPLVASPSLQSPLPPGRQADRCSVGAPGAQERQHGRGRGGQGPAPTSSAPLELASRSLQGSRGRQRAGAGLPQAPHPLPIARAAGEGRESAEKGQPALLTCPPHRTLALGVGEAGFKKLLLIRRPTFLIVGPGEDFPSSLSPL